MKILTKKKLRKKLREIEQIITTFEPLKHYSYTVGLTLYSKIKKVLLE